MKTKYIYVLALVAIGLAACKENEPSLLDNSNMNNDTVPRDSDLISFELAGNFSVSANKIVHFSQGNLQYSKSTKTWGFMDHQWSTVETSAQNMSNDVISLFGWGTGNNPSKISTDNNYATFNDWGKNIGKGWYTLSTEEWKYLFHGRTNALQLFGMGSVNGVNGTIILPNDWILPESATFNNAKGNLVWQSDGYYYNSNENNFSLNTYTVEQWSVMESAGAVFLPAAGFRIGSEVYVAGSVGCYWSSTPSVSDYAYYVYFSSDSQAPQYNRDRNCGFSVRLVR